MPSTTSTVVSACLPSSTVMTPFLPTLTKASASTAPIVGSLLPAMVATWVISFLSFSLTGEAIFSIDFGHGVLGGVDAAAQGHRVGPGGHHPQPLEVDRLGQQRGGRGAVAGDVAGLRGRFLDQLGAQVLEGVVQFDLLGDGHAVLGDFRAPQPLSSTAFRPRGPRVLTTARANLLTPAANGCRASSSKTNCFATADSSCCWLSADQNNGIPRPQLAAACGLPRIDASGVPNLKAGFVTHCHKLLCELMPPSPDFRRWAMSPSRMSFWQATRGQMGKLRGLDYFFRGLQGPAVRRQVKGNRTKLGLYRSPSVAVS